MKIKDIDLDILFNDDLNIFFNTNLDRYRYINNGEFTKDTLEDYLLSLNIPCKKIIYYFMMYIFFNKFKREYKYLVNILLNNYKTFQYDKLIFLFQFLEYKYSFLINDEKVANIFYNFMTTAFLLNKKFEPANINYFEYFNIFLKQFNRTHIFSKKIIFSFIFDNFYYCKKLSTNEKEILVNLLSNNNFFSSDEAIKFFIKYFKNKSMLKIFEEKYL